MAFDAKLWTPAGNSKGKMGLHTYVDTGTAIATVLTDLDTSEVSDHVAVGDIIAITASDATALKQITAVADAAITFGTGTTLTA